MITPNFFSDFDQFNIGKYHPNLIAKLTDLLLVKDLPINIYFNLDFSFYGVEIKNFYDTLFEQAFPIYLLWNSYFPTKVLEMINEWRIGKNIKKMPIEILIPLKGFYLPVIEKETERNHSYYDIIFVNNDDAQVYLNTMPNYSVLNYQYSSDSKKVQFIFEGIDNHLSRYRLHAKGKIFFEFQHNPQQYSFCYLWHYIKQVAEAICLEGTILRFGTPYYILPWWVSNEIITDFNFHHPDWMNDRYMTKGYYFGLVPDTEPYSTTTSRQRRKYFIKGKPFWDSDYISAHGSPLDSDTELMSELYSDKINLSKPEEIENLFKKLNERSSSINFNRDSFILDRLLRLSQRTLIEDVILDVSIILEAIFLSGKRDELSYRLKLNVSSLLCKTSDEFMEYFDFFSELYEFRSAIIHGAPKMKKSKRKKKSPYKQFVEECYPNYLDFYDPENNLMINKLNRLIQYDIFQKICKIYRKLIEFNINYRIDFEKIGFLNIFLKKRDICE